MDIKNRIAVITGGASGLGEATVRRLVSKGAKVAILDMNETAGNNLVRELGSDKVVFYKTNITITEEIKAAIDGTLKKWGRIDICCPVAGIATIDITANPAGMFDLDVFKRTINVNLIGNFDAIRQCAYYMLKNEPNEYGEKGVIVNCASMSAFTGQSGQAAYSASKGAVVSMTLPIARDLGNEGIRCNAIAPGFMDTPMVSVLPQQAIDGIVRTVLFPSRMGKADEFAFLVEHIIENPYLNAEVIKLTGGEAGGMSIPN